MAEIKSTLDLIMEKTQNMILTEDEKEEIRRKELNGKIKGWVQQYRDNVMSPGAIKSEIQKEEKNRQVELKKTLKKEIIQHIEPDEDNTKLFQLLEEILGINKDSIINMINQFQEILGIEKINKTNEMKNRLNEKGISGTAVVPNLDSDEEWNGYYLNLKEDFKEKIKLIEDN